MNPSPLIRCLLFSILTSSGGLWEEENSQKVRSYIDTFKNTILKEHLEARQQIAEKMDQWASETPSMKGKPKKTTTLIQGNLVTILELETSDGQVYQSHSFRKGGQDVLVFHLAFESGRSCLTVESDRIIEESVGAILNQQPATVKKIRSIHVVGHADVEPPRKHSHFEEHVPCAGIGTGTNECLALNRAAIVREHIAHIANIAGIAIPLVPAKYHKDRFLRRCDKDLDHSLGEIFKFTDLEGRFEKYYHMKTLDHLQSTLERGDDPKFRIRLERTRQTFRTLLAPFRAVVVIVNYDVTS